MVKRPTSAQVMISQLMGSSPVSGSVLTAQSPEPALDSVSPSLSVPPLLMFSLSLSLKNKQTLRGTWVAQSVERLTLAQVMISQLMNSSPMSGSADSSEPGACFRLRVSLSAPPPLGHSLSKMNIKNNFF